MEIKKIAVCGGGRMGRQIALNACMYGFEATVYDLIPEVCADVLKWEDEYLVGRIAKGRKTEAEVQEIKKLFHVSNNLEEAVAGVDCVIEAIIEVKEVKEKFFKQLCQIIPENVIIATNSSDMVSSLFVDSVTNPSRLANMHFYNPALVLKFVEIVQGPHTSDETARALFDFCTKTGKTPIWMKKELAGFAANAILKSINHSAMWLVEEGYCTYQEVDLACENGLGHPMGPFRLLDLTGVDLEFDILKKLYEETGVKEPMYDVLEQMVKENKLGRKTGEGFYKY